MGYSPKRDKADDHNLPKGRVVSAEADVLRDYVGFAHAGILLDRGRDAFGFPSLVCHFGRKEELRDVSDEEIPLSAKEQESGIPYTQYQAPLDAR
jgi:hypothetical protein